MLIVEADRVEEAVRDLVRIGYDRVAGVVTPEALGRYFEDGGAHEAIEEVTFEDVARLKGEPGTPSSTCASPASTRRSTSLAP